LGVFRDVLQLNSDELVRQSIPCSLRPFDDYDGITVDNIIPPNVREIVWSAKAVKVEMEKCWTIRLILIHERECRTGHIFPDSNTGADGLRERRLPCSKVPLKRDDST
jgi:hypothetical protein